MDTRAAALLAIIALTPTAVAAAPQGPAPETVPQSVTPTAALLEGAPMAVLSKDGLTVRIALPDKRHGFYRSTRFDWSGMVVDAMVDGVRFYGPWFDGVAPNVRDVFDGVDGVVVGPRNAATGPAEEFANRDGETVPGYNSTPVGSAFIKIGVGRLRKPDDQPYDHFRAYDIVDGGVWDVRRTHDRIVFHQRLAPDASGYGYDYEKTLTLLPGGGMSIAHRLRNIGSRAITTQVYTHNFARFDGAEIGRGVAIKFPTEIVGPVSEPDVAVVEGDALRYLRTVPVGKRVQLPPQPGGVAAPPGPFTVLGANGASITMEGDTPLVRTAVWSMRRTVAVEPFVAIAVPPGGEQRWSWRYAYAVKR